MYSTSYSSIWFISVINSINFILKAFKDQISLHLLNLSYFILLFLLVVLHSPTNILRRVFRMEHVCAKIEYSFPFLHSIVTHFLLSSEVHRIPLNEFRYPFNKKAVFQSCSKSFLWQIAKTYQNVYEDWRRYALFQKMQQSEQQIAQKSLIFFKLVQYILAMKTIS